MAKNKETKEKPKELSIINIGDTVKLEQGDIGIVKDIITDVLCWHPFIVQIQKGCLFDTDEIIDFKREDLTLIQ